MKTVKLFAATGLALILGLGAAQAEGPHETPIEARQGQFRLLAFNLGPLVGMTRGDIPYDAETAAAAAANMARVASLDQRGLWPEGSDNVAHDGTRALPNVWDDPDGFAEKLDALRSATRAMEAAAGDDLDALRGALGPVAQACRACHDVNRAD
ncbi:c-type cytochrome [Alkalilacustris brevis]|uniref:c-type cytochrome n=1 Tax=Alkalilacustris brevis TaxID=2026338 RepID=UPI000E0D46E5|nr:cytochrome c [Alkalilacustris brevis]